MELRRTTSVVFLAKTGTAVSTFLGFVVFARTLGGDSFGSFILFLTVLNLVGGVSDLGLDDAVEKRISEGAEGNVLASTLAIKATALAAISTLLVAGRPHLQAFVGADLAGWLIVALVTQQVGLVFNRSLKGEMRVAEAESALFVGKFAFVTSGVAALQYVTRIETLVASFWFGWFVVLVWGVARKRTPLGRVDRSSVGSLYAYAKFNFVASVLGRRMYSWVDVFVLGLFLSNAAVGAYELAWRLAGVVMLLSRSIGTAIFPQISRWDASGSGEKIQELLPQALFSSLFLVIPAVGGVFVLSEPLMRIVFSPEYLVAAGALVVLSLGKTPEAMNVITGRALLGLDRPRDTAVAGGVLIVSNVLLNFALVPTFARVGPEYGLVGAAVATTTALTLTLLTSLYFLSEQISIRFPVTKVGISVLVAGAMTAGVWFAVRVVPVTGIAELVFVVILGGSMYASGMVWIDPVKSQVLQFATFLRGLLRRVRVG